MALQSQTRLKQLSSNIAILIGRERFKGLVEDNSVISGRGGQEKNDCLEEAKKMKMTVRETKVRF